MKYTGKKKVRKNVGKLRRGQLITTFGCGAIVDLPRESVVIAGTDFWRNHEDEQYHLVEENLQKLLGVDYFVSPPGSLTDEGMPSGYGIPSFRFPTWMYCPKCKRLADARKFNFVGNPRCEKCKKNLVPSRFVVACEDGHLDDFPYEWWVHFGNKCTGKPELFIEMSEKSSGLDSIIIWCKTCNVKRSMAGSFGKDSLKGFKCTQRRPWLNDTDPAACERCMRTMQRGATNLHFCINISALSIPPWSKKVYIELEKNWSKLKPFLHDRDFFITMISGWNLPHKCGCSAEEIHELGVRKRDGEGPDSGSKNWQNIVEDEYRAFLNGSDDEKDEFKTREVDVPPIVDDYVDRVVLALRLREVMALRGFKRINADYDVDDYNYKSFNMLSREFKNWLPGVELKGEGIFIKLNEEKLAEWENKDDVIARYSYMLSAKNNSMIKGPGLSPRYVLLHTLAHLLIRQLILQCGYASAAIKERIYCTFTDSDAQDMAGILLYTATNDSEGSLGGLVREGKTELLDATFRQLLEVASWCSADPLCIQSGGQGIDALNLAACHSCTLLPETSCERRNCFLDRAALIGTLDNSALGFFSPLLERED